MAGIGFVTHSLDISYSLAETGKTGLIFHVADRYDDVVRVGIVEWFGVLEFPNLVLEAF